MPNSTPLLLETIRIEEGEIVNLPYHQARFDKSRKAHFKHTNTIDLSDAINVPSQTGVYRCRILYGRDIEEVSYHPYTPKTIQKLKIVSSNIEYPYKYADRSALESLLQEHQDADDVIIEKHGLLTDTTIANLAWYDGTSWYTPKTPLLEGTMRAKFIDKGLLHPRDIAKEDLSSFTHVALINAMLGFKILNDITII